MTQRRLTRVSLENPARLVVGKFTILKSFHFRPSGDEYWEGWVLKVDHRLHSRPSKPEARKYGVNRRAIMATSTGQDRQSLADLLVSYETIVLNVKGEVRIADCPFFLRRLKKAI